MNLTYDILKAVIPTLILLALNKLFSGMKVFSSEQTFAKLSYKKKRDFIQLIRGRNTSINYDDKIEMKNELESYNIRYRYSFMQKLFKYIEDKDLSLTNSDLSCFLKMAGLFKCGDDGTAKRRRFSVISVILLSFLTTLVLAFVFWSINNYVNVILQHLKSGPLIFVIFMAFTCVVLIIFAIILLCLLKSTVIYSIPAFRFQKKYKKYLDESNREDDENAT